MSYFYLTSSVLLSSLTAIMSAYYNRKYSVIPAATPLFTLIQLVSSFFLWLFVYAFKGSFDSGVLIYSLLFGLFYSMAIVGMIYALKYGSVALTSLLLQFSFIGVTVWGLIFWNAPFNIKVLLGILFSITALSLCILNGNKTKNAVSNHNYFVRWVVSSLIMFVGNAGCTIVQKEQQIAFNGQHGSMLMVFACMVSVLVGVFLFIRNDRSGSRTIAKNGVIFPIVAGVSNTITNLFVIILATSELSSNLIFPVIAIGGLSINLLFSLSVFKEKLKWWQWIGFAVGVVAITLLST